MVGEWKQSRLGDHITLKGGLSYKGEFVDKGDALLIGMGCVSHTERFLHKGGRQYGGDFNEAHLVRPGDLVIATRQQSDNLPILGFPAMIPEDLRGRNVIAATNLYKVTNHSEISNRFLYWLMRSPAYRERILGCAKGSTVRMLTKDAIEDFDFLCPPEEEREAIAEILDTLVDKIELNRRMNETLESIARAIFKSWFVDFDPVRAKMSGEAPESICQRLGLTSDLLALFPEHLVDSELGEIPEGWGVRTVEDLSLKVGMGPFGSNIKVSTFVEYGVPVISGQHLKGTMLEDNSYKFVTVEHADRLASSNVGRGDVVFTHAGNIGQVAYIPDHSRYERYVLSQRQFYMRCDLTKISPLLITYYFRSPEGQHKLLANASQVGVPSIARPVSYLKSIDLVTPPKALSDKFDELIRMLQHRISVSLLEINTLAELRDSLLPKLLSGELRVPNVEKALDFVA